MREVQAAAGGCQRRCQPRRYAASGSAIQLVETDQPVQEKLSEMSPHVSETTYDFPIPGTNQQDWFRVRIVTVDGRVTDFTVQYETLINGKFLPVARYDCAHGYPHRDLLNREGKPRVPKLPFAQQLSLDDALQIAVQD